MKKDFFIANRSKISERMSDNSLLILFAGEGPKKSADEKYQFTPNRNFYYLTGIDKEKIIFLIKKQDDKVEEMLFIEKSDPVLEKWIGKRITDKEASELSGIDNIMFIDSFYNKLNYFINRCNVENIYLDFDGSGVEEPLNKAQAFSKELLDRYPFINVKNIYNDICSLRRFKSKEEIENIRQAIDITNEGVRNMLNHSKCGMMEYELEAYFDFSLKSRGIKDFAFKTILASGENGTVLHYSENNSRIKDDSMILVDLGAAYKYYSADISRTFPASGKFTDRQKEIYNIVLKAEIETIKSVKPGLHFKELNKIAKGILAEECLKIGLIKEESEISKYYYHGVSHYLGLDTHDVGDYDVELKPGMVITMEPGLYIEEEKIGIRIEDDVLVTDSGNEVLSKDIIKTVEEIEDFMNS